MPMSWTILGQHASDHHHLHDHRLLILPHPPRCHAFPVWGSGERTDLLQAGLVVGNGTGLTDALLTLGEGGGFWVAGNTVGSVIATLAASSLRPPCLQPQTCPTWPVGCFLGECDAGPNLRCVWGRSRGTGPGAWRQGARLRSAGVRGERTSLAESYAGACHASGRATGVPACSQ